MNILMGLNPLPQYKLYWHQIDFIGNGGSKNYDMQKIPKAAFDRANEPGLNSADFDKLYKIFPVLNVICDSFADSYKPGQNQTVEGVIALKGRLHAMYNISLPNQIKRESVNALWCWYNISPSTWFVSWSRANLQVLALDMMW